VPAATPRATAEESSPTVAEVEPSATPAPPEPEPLPTGIEPVHVAIPAIGVDATIIRLDIRGDEPDVPSNFAEVGWYHQTRLPGEIGPAVLAGHIDSRSGPAVFYRLNELVVDDEISVTSADGESRIFVVNDSGQYAKERLPAEVFGFGEPKPEIRLITCGGAFDTGSGHYRDNYVVYAGEK